MRYTIFSLIIISISNLAAPYAKAQEAQSINQAEEADHSLKSEKLKEATDARPEDPSTFGDWKITCPGGAPCRMAQSIVTANDNRIILQMRVFKGKDGAKDTALFSFPLGILLNTGWQIKIDNGKTQLLPFEICKEDGCHSGINIPNSLLNAMKRGNILNVKFFDASQKAIEPKISLKGFTKAYGELK